MRLNWKLLSLAMIAAGALVLGSGCSGINASGSVSPATFLLPGLMQADPPRTPDALTPDVAPAVPVTHPEAVPILARSH